MSISPYSDLSKPEPGSEQPEPETALQTEPLTELTEPQNEPVEGASQRRPRRRLQLFGLGILAVTAWWFMSPSGSLVDRDLVFLPNEPVLIVHAKVTELENCELFTDLKKLTESMGIGEIAGVSAQPIKELKDSLDTVTFGVSSPGSSRNPDDVVACGVIRCRRDLLLEDMTLGQFSTQPMTEEVSGERSIISFQGAAYCQIDPRTIVVGNLKGVRAVLSRDLEPATLSDQMSNALWQSDLTNALTVVAAIPAESLEDVQPLLGFAPPQAVVITADVDKDIHLGASLLMQNKSDIEALQTRAQSFLAKLQSPDAARLVEALEFSSSGTTLVVSATIPGAPLVEMAKTQASGLASQFARSQTPMQVPGEIGGTAPPPNEQVLPGPTGEDEVSASLTPDISPDQAMPSLKAESPQEAFEGLTEAAAAGAGDRVLGRFTEAGRQAIAGDLANVAQQDVAFLSHLQPEVASEFRELQMKYSPEFQGEDDSSDPRTQLAYLQRITEYLGKHWIAFAGLAEMYAPCVLRDVVTKDDWALGSVRYDKDEVVREVTLGFLKEGGQWRICILDEIPSHVVDSLLEGR
jgi:hypothetical protein